MWKRQKSFNKNFVDFNHMDFNKSQEMTKEYALHLISEVTDLLSQVNWKMHHKSNLEVKRSDLVLEVIDIWKYLLSICLIWDIKPDEFCKAFDEKSGLVEQKYLQEFAQLEGKEVVICDIDGVLGDYPYTFLEFVRSQEKLKGRNPGFMSRNVWTLDLYKYLEGEVASSDLREYKRLYRESGEIRKETVYQDSVNFLHTLKEKGYYVVLLTSRPFDEYKSLYLDTYIWLESHGFEYDMLINDDKKRNKVSKLLETSDVKFVVDDDPKILGNLEGLDKLHNMFLVDRSYNGNFECKGKVKRVSSLSEIINNYL